MQRFVGSGTLSQQRPPQPRAAGKQHGRATGSVPPGRLPAVVHRPDELRFTTEAEDAEERRAFIKYELRPAGAPLPLSPASEQRMQSGSDEGDDGCGSRVGAGTGPGGEMHIRHVVVPPGLQGHSYGEALATAALTWAHQQRLAVRTACSFLCDDFLPQHAAALGFVVQPQEHGVLAVPNVGQPDA